MEQERKNDLLLAKQEIRSKFKREVWLVSVGVGLVEGWPGLIISVTPQAPLDLLSASLEILPWVPHRIRVMECPRPG